MTGGRVFSAGVRRRWRAPLLVLLAVLGVAAGRPAPMLSSAPMVGVVGTRTAGTVVDRTGFVTRSGNLLMLGGAVFRFAGTNEYYLGLDDNLRDSTGAPTYPTHARIDDALASAVRTGATVIRANTLGISVGCARCFEPSNGVFQPQALDSGDYALYRAGKLGLKVIVPLVDQWRYYHGGESVFTGWHGYPNNPNPAVNAGTNHDQRVSEAHFYTDYSVVQDFKWYVANLLNHVNPYTGLAYKSDPTVLAWETGNELWTAPTAWTSDLAQYIKQYLGAAQLVADGSAANGMSVANAALDSPWVDIVGGHFYPIDVGYLTSDAALAAAHQKAYVIGEFDWRSASNTSALVNAVQTNRNISGDLYWTLMPHLENGAPEPHGDGYAMWSPATTTSAAQILAVLTAHGSWMAAAH